MGFIYNPSSKSQNPANPDSDKKTNKKEKKILWKVNNWLLIMGKL